jgi:DNA polymerase-3 subunit epsilon
MTIGISTRPAEMRLTERAADFLAAGPADVVALIGHICQLPNPPRVVAEHMATALFTGRTEFLRTESGQWSLTPAGPAGQPGQPGMSSLPGRVSEPYRAAYTRPGAADLLSSLSYVVVDVETTGTRARHGDRVTEIAAVVVRDGEVREVFETLVNPQRPIPPFISALTNITWSMVKDAPVFRDVCERFLTVLEGNIFVAHNAGFDWRFIAAEVSRASGQQLVGRQLCTVRLARKLLPHLRSRSLDNVAAYYGVDIKARHRAGGDALATAHVLLGLLRDARDRGCESWPALEALIARRKPRARRGRPSAMPRSVDRDCGA